MNPLTNPRILALCIAAWAGSLHAQIVRNPGLQVNEAVSPIPEGWRADGRAERMAADPTVQVAGRPTLRIDYVASAPYAGLVQRLDASVLTGRRVLVLGWLARDREAAAVGVWIRAFNAERQSVAYANSYEQPLPADRTVRRHELSFVVPADAVAVLVGASVYGADGSAWFGGIDVRAEGHEARPGQP